MKKANVLELGLSCPFIKGGVESFVWNIYTNMNLEKIEADFWGYKKSSEKYMKYISERNSVFYVFNSTNNVFIKQFEKIINIKNIVKENKYDCVHIHVGSAFAAFIYYCGVRLGSKNVNIILHSHSSGNNGLVSKTYLGKALCTICKYLINDSRIIRLACSNEAGNWLYPTKYKFDIIKNGIDVSKFVFNIKIRNKIREELHIENKFVIGHVGRFTREKNHEFLIDIFSEIYKQNANAVLLLIGEGELENQIKDKVHELKLDKVVIFYGTTSYVNELYQAMDCFILPSQFEGMPIVLVEAQAMALKTVCSDAVTPEAKITDLLDYMPLSLSAEAWARKILSYNINYERKNMSDEITAAGYDIKQTVKQLEDIYCSLKIN